MHAFVVANTAGDASDLPMSCTLVAATPLLVSRCALMRLTTANKSVDLFATTRAMSATERDGGGSCVCIGKHVDVVLLLLDLGRVPTVKPYYIPY